MKNKKSLKIVSLILAIVMAISIMPIAAFADEISKREKEANLPHGTATTVVYNYMLSEMISANSFESLTGTIEESIQNVLSGKIAIPEVKVTLTDADGDSWEMTKSEHSPISDVVSMKSENTVIQWALSSVEGFTDALATKLLQGLDGLSGNTVSDLMNLVYVGYTAEVPIGTYTAKVEYFDRDGYVVNQYTKDNYTVPEEGFVVEVKANETTNFGADLSLKGQSNGIIDYVAKWLVEHAKFDDSTAFGKAVNLVIDMSADLAVNTLKTFIKVLPIDIYFHGIWTDFNYPEFTFTNVDLGGTPVVGTTFLMVNRNEMIGLLHWVEDIGEVAFNNTLDYMATLADSEDTLSFKETVDLITSVIELDTSKEEGLPIQIDYTAAKELIITVAKVALGSSAEGADALIDAAQVIYASYQKNEVVIPAILQATSEEDGHVTFSPEKNITLVWEIQLVQKIIDKLVDSTTDEDSKEKIVSVLSQIFDEKTAKIMADVYAVAAPMLADASGVISDKLIIAINKYGYYLMEGIGLVGEKMYSGNYILMNSVAADGFLLNPLAYTVEITWDRNDEKYAKVADLGIVAPYFASDFYAFVRNTTGAKVADSYLNLILGGKVDAIQKILNNDVDLTAEMIAFFALMNQNMLGGNLIKTSDAEMALDLTKYLYANGRTIQNLIVFANDVAKKSKQVYTSDIDEDWYYYSMKENIFENVKDKYTAIINKVTASIKDPDSVTNEELGNTGNLTKSEEKETYTPGTTAKTAVTAVTTATKNVASAIKTTTSRLTTTLTKAVSTTVKVLSKLFSR